MPDEPCALPVLTLDAPDSIAVGPAVASDAPSSSSDRRRFERIAVEHYDFVWRVLRRAGLPSPAADDATQQVFLVASRRIADIAEGSEKAFLYRSAALIALDARRRHARRREDPGEAALARAVDPSPGPDELTDAKMTRHLLDEALSDLDDDLHEVFTLFELDAMPIQEIAALLEIPEGTCSSRLRRAREKFKAAVTRLRARTSRRSP